MRSPAKVLVTGSREWDDIDVIWRALNRIHLKTGIELVIHGGANGADGYADLWARGAEINQCVIEADWDKYGKKAGPIRNQALIEKEPDIVLAYPLGGPGTKDMISRAKKAHCVRLLAIYDAEQRRYERVLYPARRLVG